MRKKSTVTIKLLVVFSLVFYLVAPGFTGFSQDNGESYSINLCNYTIPETTYQSLDLNFDYHFYDDPELSDAGDINRGSAFGNYGFIYTHPDYSLNLASNASVSLSQDELTYDAVGEARYNAYLTETDLFGFGGFQTTLSSSFSENVGVKVLTGSGFGRFKNVTPLVKAVLIRNMLQRRYVTDDVLPARLTRQIAQLIDKMGPEKSLDETVSDITDLLESDPDFEVEKLGAVEVLRVREIIQEGTDQRLCGWEIRAGLGYEAIDPQGEARDFLVDGAIRFARPFTTSSQLTLGLDFTSPFELTESYTINALASYTYQFNRNVDTKFQYSLLYKQGNALYYNHNYSATADIRIRRDLTSSVTVKLNDNSGYEEMTKEITIGLSYSLL